MSFFSSIDQVNNIQRLEDLTNHSYTANLTDSQSLEANLRGAGTHRVQISGTWSGVLIFEHSIDGTTWTQGLLLPFGSIIPTANTAFTPATTANGQWVGSAAAFQKFRVRASGITGMAAVHIEVNHAVAVTNSNLFADGFIDINNTTLVPLAANATFIGASTVMLPYVGVSVTLATDQASALTGCFFEFSIDNVNWDVQLPFIVLANQPMICPFDRKGIFFRIVYKNGANAQGFFRMLSVLQRASSEVPKHLLNNPIFAGQTAVLCDAVMSGTSISDSTIMVKLLCDPDGTLHVSPAMLAPDASRASKQDVQTAELTSIDSQLTSIKIDVDKIPADPAKESGHLANLDARQTAAASAVTSVPAAISSTSLLAVNANRKGATFYNDSAAILYLKFGTPASISDYTVQMPAAVYFEAPWPIYTGAIAGIWSSATGAVKITELS